jgi:hypothetical protein
MTALRRKSIDRDSAMAARPRRLPAVRTQPRDGGGLVVTVELRRPRWQRWLSGSETFEHSFGLDEMGREVYDLCDGKTTVRRMVRRFAGRHRLSEAEAEMAVTAFLKTLTAKGLVGMEIKRPPKKGRS